MKLLFLFSAGTLLALVDAAAYLQTTLTKGATMHQFHLAKGWEKDQSVINARMSVKTVMQKMNTKGSGMFTAIILEGADTCVRRSTAGNGLQSPLDYAKSQPSASTFLLTNGGFFLNDKSPKNDYSVGPTSGKNAQYVPVPEVYRNVFGRLGGDDGSFLECGPVLGKPIDQSEDRFQYFEKGSNPKVESEYAKLPGGVATANENNERLAMVKMGPRHKVVFAYTGVRDHGVKINDLRALMDSFLQGFLGKGIEKADLALNLDGGRSIFVGWQTNGVMKPIVCGGMDENQKPGFRDAKEMTIRPVPNFIRHSFGATAGTTAGGSKPGGDAGAAKKPGDKSATPPATETKKGGSRPGTPTGNPTPAKPGPGGSGGSGPSGSGGSGPSGSGSGSSTPGKKGGATTPTKPKGGRKSMRRRRAVSFKV